MSETNEASPATNGSDLERVVRLPELRSDLRDFEKQAGISVDVLVRAKGWQGICIGRYLHGLGEWQLNQINGAATVYEWWPMPEEGTGYAT